MRWSQKSSDTKLFGNQQETVTYEYIKQVHKICTGQTRPHKRPSSGVGGRVGRGRFEQSEAQLSILAKAESGLSTSDTLPIYIVSAPGDLKGAQE